MRCACCAAPFLLYTTIEHMAGFIVKKFLYSLLVLLGAITLGFFIIIPNLPGDPARLMLGQRADEASVKALREQYGFDKPVYVQYVRYVGRVIRGDLGRSSSTNRDVLETIVEKFPATALLTVTSIIIATVLGIIIGMLAATKPNSWWDSLLMTFAQLGISLPSFVAALLAILVFGVILDWFPISGYIDRGYEFLILPALTLGLRPLSIIARVTRSSMLDVLGQDYIRTAKAKGLATNVVITRHALRNALNPVVTTIGAWFASLLSGAFFIESMFNWPGLGTFAFAGIEKLDYNVILGTVLVSAAIFVIVNMLVDILYAFLDPRIRLQ